MHSGGSDDATGPDDRGARELRMRQDHGVAANLYVLVDDDRLRQPHCDTLAHEALPLSPKPARRGRGRRSLTPRASSGSANRGDRPRLIVLSRGDGDRDQVRQVELARGHWGGSDPAPTAPNGHRAPSARH